MPFILLGFHRLSKRLALLPPSKLLLRWTNSNGNPMKSLMFNRKYMWIVGCHTNLATIKSWLFTDVHKTERPSDALDLRSKGDIKVMLGGDVSGVLFQEGFKLCFPAVRKKTKITLEGFVLFHFLGEYCIQEEFFYNKVPCGNIHAILISWNRKWSFFPSLGSISKFIRLSEGDSLNRFFATSPS